MNSRVGYRFHPTEKELISYFLKQKIDGTLHSGDILQIDDMCKILPWDLPKHTAQGSNGDEWYFFHKRELASRNPSKPRYKRSNGTGHWKPTGKDRRVKAKLDRSEIGVKRNLVFYKYTDTKKELKTNWVIHEYQLKGFPHQQADLVLCKLKEKAESVTGSEAESSCQGPSDFDTFAEGLSSSELLLPPMVPNNGINFNQPNAWQPRIEIEGGISIDDLELSDDVFQSGFNGLSYQFGTTDQQWDPNEIDVSLFGGNFSSALNSHTHFTPSSSSQSQNGIYLEDLDNFNGMSSHYGDSYLNYGNSGPREYYRQMESVKSLTRTLPAPKLELQTCWPSRYEKSAGTKKKINSTGKASNDARSNKHTVEVKMAAGKIIFQHKLLRPFELRAREARKPGIDLNLPLKSPKEKIPMKTESGSNQKMVNAYINTETLVLHQRAIYVINISIGLVLFVAVVRDLMIVH